MMPENWRSVRLEDIASKDYGLVDGPFGSNLPASLYVNDGIPVVRGSNLSLGEERFRADEFVFVSEETYQRLERSSCKPGDIIFTKKGTLGQAGFIPDNIGYDKLLVSSNQMKLTVEPSAANPLYVYYYVSSPESRDKIIRESTASGVPKTNLAYLRKFPIVLPPLPEQHAISRILGALDDKIELNRRMNHTLESMAQALFKSWFVDFDPVVAKSEGRQPYGMNAETAALFPSEFEETGIDEFESIPAGWRIESLAEIAKYENGLALQKYRPEGLEYLPVIKIRELRQGSPDSNSEKASPNIKSSCIIDDGDIIFSWSGSLLIDIWCGGKGALNQHLFKVTSDKYPKWFYYYWTNHHLADFQDIAEGKATTMGHIQRRHLESAKVVIPPDTILEKANKSLLPMLDQIVKNRLQSRTLSSIRDALLPKLLSGEIRVKIT